MAVAISGIVNRAQDKKAKGSITVSDIIKVSPSMDVRHTLAFLVETSGT